MSKKPIATLKKDADLSVSEGCFNDIFPMFRHLWRGPSLEVHP